MGATRTTTSTLWCEPGAGYSYATSSIHLAGMVLRHVTGQDLRDYVDEHLARPLGWGRWDSATADLLGGRNPIGARVRQAQSGRSFVGREIVGYVKDATYRDLREPVPPTIYIPYVQQGHRRSCP